MWLAVLFVGVFGGDFVSNSSANGFTEIPVVVFLLPFVLPASSDATALSTTTAGRDALSLVARSNRLMNPPDTAPIRVP
jgi:hypothetical protein